MILTQFAFDEELRLFLKAKGLYIYSIDDSVKPGIMIVKLLGT